MGSGIAHVCALAGSTCVMRYRRRGAAARRWQAIDAQYGPPGRARPDHRGRQGRGADAHHDRRRLRRSSATATSSSRRRPRRKRSSARSSRSCARCSKPDAMIATNTSSISITRLAAATDRPGKFIGMHFMNPVPVMQLVELIRGIATDEETFAADPRARREARQDAGRRRGFPGLHRQPHPAADDQRGGLHAL